MESKKKKRLVPYEMVSPGFEAVYPGEKSSSIDDHTDQYGNVIEKWSPWTWTWPGGEHHAEILWDDETKYVNKMQEKLGLLDDAIRQIRAHIGSLVPCESGIPVTIDELLEAIGRGELGLPSFHNGCWYAGMWWEERETNPAHVKSFQIIEEVLRAYLAGKSGEELVAKFPYARGFISRTYEWLGPVDKLTKLQELMLKRMLLPFEFFVERNRDYDAVNKNCFEEGGDGSQLDAEISELAGLPKIHANYKREFRENLDAVADSQKKELYRICAAIAHGIHGLSDCHHSSFRWVETWIHGIGTGKWGIPTRKAGTERERLGRLLFGYVLGLDRWLLDIPMQFLLLGLGHIELGFDPKNEIVRVYAYLGEEKTPVKEWLAACLWHDLMYSTGGLVWQDKHKVLLDRAEQAGISVREWMDSALKRD